MGDRLEPRPYQLELFEAAKTRNIIAYLDTGAGKTLVSVLLIEHFATALLPVPRSDIEYCIATTLLSDDEKSKREVKFDGALTALCGIQVPVQPKKIIFCVPTVALVNQQAEKIRQNTDLVVGEYSGDETTSLTYWDALGFYVEMSQRHVLVMTPQIFLNILRHGFMKLTQHVSLIIFDEAHHARKNHPYGLIMAEFYHTAAGSGERPKIFGMTASPIHQKANTHLASITTLNELQTVLDCSVVTVTDRSKLDGFVARAREIVLEYDPPPLVNDLDALKDDAQFAGEDVSTSLSALYRYLRELKPTSEVQEETKKRTAGQKILAEIKEVRDELGVWRSDLTEKTWALIHLLEERVSTPKKMKAFRGMVFVERRATATALSDLLVHIAPHRFKGIRTAFVTGHGSNAGAAKKMSSSYQVSVFDKFRSGEVNLLVVTRVAEEGIDIPSCKLVIIFNVFRSNTGYVQSRGRARDVSGSEYIVLVERNNALTMETLCQAKVAELMTRNAALALGNEKDDSLRVTKGLNDNRIVSKLLGTDDVVKTTVAAVSLQGAELVLLRYLRGKPSYSMEFSGNRDERLKEWERYRSFKRSQDEYVKLEESECASCGFAYSVYIPDSAREFIYGSVRFTQKLAKMSAALEAVRYLYAEGKLNENLLSTRSMTKGSSRFSFSQEIKKLIAERKLTAADVDAGTGLLRRNEIFTFQKAVPRAFSVGPWWNNVVPSFDAQDSSPFLPELIKDALCEVGPKQFYFTIVSLGPHAEEYSRRCKPPKNAFRDLCYPPFFPAGPSPFCHHYYYFPEDSDCYVGSSSRFEPRRTFCILTKFPISVESVPSFMVLLLDNNTPCKVDVIPNRFFDKPTASGVVTFTEEELAHVVSFQKNFWSDCFRVETTDADADFSSTVYLVMPMIGVARKPVKSKPRTRAIDEPILPTVVAENIKSVNDLPGPCDCSWQFDWNLVHRVVNAERVPLYDWVRTTAERAEELLGKTEVKRQRIEKNSLILEHLETVCVAGDEDSGDDSDSLGSPAESLFDVEESVSFYTGFYDAYTNDDVTMGRIDLDALEASSTPQDDAAGLSFGKRKREIDTVLDGAFSDTETEPSFELLFARALRTTSSSDFSGFSDRKVVDKMSSILRQIVFETPHNHQKYFGAELRIDLSPESTFEYDNEKKTFRSHAEERGYVVKHDNSFMVEASRIPPTRSFVKKLRPSNPRAKPLPRNTVYVIPEAANVLPFPAEVLLSAQLLPSILYKLEMYAVVDEFRRALSFDKLSNCTLIQAFTATSAGESYNYERLETLGDSILKYLVSHVLCDKFRTKKEGFLSDRRGEIVSNKHLCRKARDKGLGAVVFVASFSPKSWSPPGSNLVKSGGDNAPADNIGNGQSASKRTIGEKKLGDFVEAILGAVYVDCGIGASIEFMRRFDLISVDFKPSKALEGDTCLATGLRGKIQQDQKFAGFPFDLLEERIGYKFKDRFHLFQAICHRSAFKKSAVGGVLSYERLEFLGDAVLDFMIIRHFYVSYNDLSPEKLSELRVAAVNNESFCRVSLAIGLQEVLLHDDERLKADLESYLDYMGMPGSEALHPFETQREGPKELADVFEALVGAVYVDAGNDVEIVWETFRPLLTDFFSKHANPDVVQKSPIRQMHEFFQKVGFAATDVWYSAKEILSKRETIHQCTIHLLYVSISTADGNTANLARRLATIGALTWIKDHGDDIVELLSISQRSGGKIWAEATEFEHLELSGDVEEEGVGEASFKVTPEVTSKRTPFGKTGR
ncbi:hypothetical protein HK101_001034 [Irineochytrium annulatum]|nr:hypothetical protein HK101_001034 [Irineochytrium annulatum]